MSRIVVLGSGAWGTAIALSLHRRRGHEVTLWSHSEEEAQQIVEASENKLFLAGVSVACGPDGYGRHCCDYRSTDPCLRDSL